MNRNYPHSIRNFRPRRGGLLSLLVIAIVATLMVGGGVYWAFFTGEDSEGEQPIVVPVEKTSFVAQVLDQGSIQSSENIEIRCEVRPATGSINVIEVIPEGTRIVNTKENPKDKDLVLIRLDSKSFEKEFEQQKLALNTARTVVIQSKAALQAAQESEKEYLQGIFVEGQKTIQNEIYNAEQEVQQAQAYLAHSTKLQKRGFYTKQQLNSDKIAVQRAKNSLELAKKKLFVLETVTKKKEEIRLESDIAAAKVKYENDQEAKKIEQSKLDEIETQIKNCVIKPPLGVNGQVVFAQESKRGGDDWILEEGASVRERQVLMRVPNPEKMEVKALINEQSITMIGKGMPCSIKVDALQNVKLKGFVTSVSQYPENEGWMSSSIKKFPVLVKIIDPPTTLKPGLNASVTIQTYQAEDCLQVPLQCIFAADNSRYCLVRRGEKWETVEVKVTNENSKNVLIESGVDQGEMVAMNPGRYRHLLDLPDTLIDTKIELPEGVKTGLDKNAAREAVGEDGPSNDSPAGQASGGGRPSGAGGGRPGGSGGRPGGGSGMNADSIVDMMMQRMDKNSDGILDENELKEIPENRREQTMRADSNKDGKISRDEMLESMKSMMKRMQQGGGGMGGGR